MLSPFFPWREEEEEEIPMMEGGATVVFPFKEERRRRRFTIFTFRAELPPQENWKQRFLIHFADLRNGLAVKGKLLAFFPHYTIFLRLMILEEEKIVANFYVQIREIIFPKMLANPMPTYSNPRKNSLALVGGSSNGSFG